METEFADLIVRASADDPRQGSAFLGGRERRFRCALGKGGVSVTKREGDGATPIGRFALRGLLYRPDRERPPVTGLKLRALALSDGWCDDPASADYNRPVRLPHAARCETLWREDRVYDLIAIVGYNDAPPVAGRGSAIFIHLARPDFSPTEGCVAFARDDLLAILRALGPSSMLVVEAPL